MKIIPVYTEQDKQFFSEHGVPTNVRRGFEIFQTHHLKPGVTLSLLNLSRTQESLKTGVWDSTSVLDPSIRLTGLLLRIVKDDQESLYYHETGDPTAIAHANKDNYRVMSLMYSESLTIVNKEGGRDTVFLQVVGNLNLAIGEIRLDADFAMYRNPDFTDYIEVVGYDLDVYRT
jgi:hypothetical protein